MMVNNKPIIAFIGIGLMGRPMARRLLQAGYSLKVYNRSDYKSKALEKFGAHVVDTIADAVCDVDIIFTSLSGSDAIETVYFGEQGIASNAVANSLIIDLSSLAPDIAGKNHQRLHKAGYRHLDAPVTGGVSGAEAGTLSILVGGIEADFHAGRTVLEAMGKPFYMGEEGAGQVCKLVNQTIVHVFIGAVSEGMLLAASAGIEAGKIRQALLGGYCQSKVLDIHGDKMAKRDFTPGGPLEFSVKDLEGAKQMADLGQVSLPLAEAVLAKYHALVTDGKGRLDHSALLLQYEKDNFDNISEFRSDT